MYGQNFIRSPEQLPWLVDSKYITYMIKTIHMRTKKIHVCIVCNIRIYFYSAIFAEK